MELDSDTIAAIATAPGAAGLAVVRVSGPGALRVADAVFRGRASLAEAPGHTLHHGWAVRAQTSAPECRASGAGALPTDAHAGGARAPADRIDEVLAAVFRAPRSYTREDAAELSCHGGRFAAERILAALIAAGARLARPGEFTLRAFLNGRLDLAQAEAVADLIHAETRAAHDLAVSQLAGALSREIEALITRVTDALSEVEARVDFAEDVGGTEVPPHVVAAISGVEEALGMLRDGAAWARAVREGVRVPIVGRPNGGKSSLFNALLGEERAIVTGVPGTTRDRVSEAVEIGGVRVTLSDTAGLRESEDPLEALGIARSREALAEAAAVVWVVDGAGPLAPEDRALAVELGGKRLVVALNKRDLPARVSREEIARLPGAESAAVVRVSAVTREGLDELRAAIATSVGAAGARGDLAGAAANPRHAEALDRAAQALARARAAAGALPGEIVALELREALSALGEVTGVAVGEDLLDRIFSRFCIGK